MFNYFHIGEISGDLYIGTGAGKKLFSCIERAEKSIKICSPYISSDCLSTLLDKKDNGVAIECITHNVLTTNNDDLSELYQRFIKRTLQTDTVKEIEKRCLLLQSKQEKKFSFIFLGIGLLCGLISIFSITNFLPFFDKSTSQHSISILSSILFMVFITCGIKYIRISEETRELSKNINEEFYTYNLTSNIYLVQRTSDVPFPHLKLFIIDNTIAFLGSLNATSSGRNWNVESSICINDKDTISKLNNYFEKISERYQQNIEQTVNELGKQYY